MYDECHFDYLGGMHFVHSLQQIHRHPFLVVKKCIVISEARAILVGSGTFVAIVAVSNANRAVIAAAVDDLLPSCQWKLSSVR